MGSQNIQTYQINNYQNKIREKILSSFQRVHNSKVSTQINQKFKPESNIEIEAFKQKMHSVMFKDDVFKEVYTTPSTNQEVIKIENELKNMGVYANFNDDLSLAQTTLKALTKIKTKGYRLPNEIFTMSPSEDKTQGYTFCVKTSGKEKYSPIFLKKDLVENYSYDANKEMLRKIGLRPLTVDTPEGTIFHEMGHYLHNLNGYNRETNQKIWDNVISSNKYELAREVSTYAFDGDRCGCDFVAEVFAGTMNGEKYSNAVMDLYYALNGPKIHF